MTIALEQTAAQRLAALAPFKNEAIRTFAGQADRQSLEAALVRARAACGKHYPVFVDGAKLESAASIVP